MQTKITIFALFLGALCLNAQGRSNVPPLCSPSDPGCYTQEMEYNTDCPQKCEPKCKSKCKPKCNKECYNACVEKQRMASCKPYIVYPCGRKVVRCHTETECIPNRVIDDPNSLPANLRPENDPTMRYDAQGRPLTTRMDTTTTTTTQRTPPPPPSNMARPAYTMGGNTRY